MREPLRLRRLSTNSSGSSPCERLCTPTRDRVPARSAGTTYDGLFSSSGNCGARSKEGWKEYAAARVVPRHYTDRRLRGARCVDSCSETNQRARAQGPQSIHTSERMKHALSEMRTPAPQARSRPHFVWRCRHQLLLRTSAKGGTGSCHGYGYKGGRKTTSAARADAANRPGIPTRPG